MNMNPFPPKKPDTTIRCEYCKHPLLQDPKTKEWFHAVRGADNSCMYQDKSGYCGCTTPLNTNAPPVRPVTPPLPSKPIPVQEPEPEPEPIEEPTPEPVATAPSQADAVETIINYLIKENNYAVSDCYLIIDIVRQRIMNQVMNELYGGKNDAS